MGFNGEVEAVQVSFAEAPLFDLQQLHFFKLFEIGADAALRGSHVLGKGELAGKARVVGPGVFEQHRVSEFCTYRNSLVGENKIRHLGEAVARGEVGADNLDVAVFENVGNGPRRLIFHQWELYAACESLPAAYPLFTRAVGRVREIELIL